MNDNLNVKLSIYNMILIKYFMYPYNCLEILQFLK